MFACAAAFSRMPAGLVGPTAFLNHRVGQVSRVRSRLSSKEALGCRGIRLTNQLALRSLFSTRWRCFTLPNCRPCSAPAAGDLRRESFPESWARNGLGDNRPQVQRTRLREPHRLLENFWMSLNLGRPSSKTDFSEAEPPFNLRNYAERGIESRARSASGWVASLTGESYTPFVKPL